MTAKDTIIIFESHATTEDNEAQLASGWYDTKLSDMGTKQANELGKRYNSQDFDVIFCSDLQRSYKTAEIAFYNTIPLIRDSRLRECNYGNLTRSPMKDIQALKTTALTKPFPEGESFHDTSKRMKSFLKDLLKNYHGKKILLIGHRATQYGLDEHINHLTLEEAVMAPWKWQPGWKYVIPSDFNLV